MAMLEVKVMGRPPGLMTRNPASMGIRTPGPGRDIPTPEEEAEQGTYRLEDGSCGIPGAAFRGALVKAAGAWKAKRGRGSLKGVVGHVVVLERIVPLVDPADGTPLRSYIIDTQRAVVHGQGVLRSRPLFEKWQATFTIEYDPALIDPESLLAVLEDAGARIGVGDYRPERGGPYGRFDVVA